MKIDKQQVLDILRKLLDQAVEIEADTGTMPTAEEALSWAIGEIELITSGPN
jgi:hypothetical protein